MVEFATGPSVHSKLPAYLSRASDGKVDSFGTDYQFQLVTFHMYRRTSGCCEPTVHPDTKNQQLLYGYQPRNDDCIPRK